MNEEQEKKEYWTNPDGREIPTRDALPSEEFSLGMYEEDNLKGIPGDIANCAIGCKAGDLPNVMLTTPEKRKEFGLKIGHKAAVIPFIDESSPVGYVRLRFQRRGEKLTKQFDDGKKVESTFVHFRVPKDKVAARRAREEKKAAAAAKAEPAEQTEKSPETPKVPRSGPKRAKERGGFRERTHTIAAPVLA